MPYRRSHPGLDQVLDVEALDAFIDSVPLALEEPPPRLWPTVLAVAASASAVGFLAGIAAAGYVSFWLALAVILILTAGCAVAAVVDQHPDTGTAP